MTKQDRKMMIKIVCENIIYHLKEEAPELDFDVTYTAPRLVSRYIVISLSNERSFTIRVSDHKQNRNRQCDYNVVVENGDIKLCSTVMDILRTIKGKV